jgi:hypothetical protein
MYTQVVLDSIERILDKRAERIERSDPYRVPIERSDAPEALALFDEIIAATNIRFSWDVENGVYTYSRII